VVKVLAGNKCECVPPQRAVEKEKGEKVGGHRMAPNRLMPRFDVDNYNGSTRHGGGTRHYLLHLWKFIYSSIEM
jgi:hypothetical protein